MKVDTFAIVSTVSLSLSQRFGFVIFAGISMRG
jgi:hypothetical protein